MHRLLLSFHRVRATLRKAAAAANWLSVPLMPCMCYCCEGSPVGGVLVSLLFALCDALRRVEV